MLPIYWLVICEDGCIDTMHYDNEASRDAHILRELKSQIVRGSAGIHDGSEIDGMDPELAYEHAQNELGVLVDMKWGCLVEAGDILSEVIL